VSNGTTSDAIAGTQQLSLNEWSHVVGVFDAGSLKLYVNGTLAGSKQALSVFSIQNTTKKVQISGWDGDGDNPFPKFSGLLDEVRLYNRALSVAEVMSLYTMGR